MKLVTYLFNNNEYLGAITPCGTKIMPLAENGFPYKDMNDIISNITDVEKQALNSLIKSGIGEGIISIDSVKLLAPIPEPKQDILCLGINYWAHAEESVRYKKEAFDGDRKFPVYFSKRVNRAVADKESIQSHNDIISTLDYEAELAVIIGKDAKNVSLESVSDYIFGYTIINDVTARELQTRHKQWTFGKGLDGFAPMGPCIVTADEIAFPPVLKIKSYVNGELRQDASTDMFIHDISYVINELSKGMTLKAGTIIATGTPAGVGMGFVPPKFLKTGDTVVCEIENIGKITNTVE